MNLAPFLLPVLLAFSPQDDPVPDEAARAARVSRANDFALRLHRELAREGGNVFAAPHSLSVAFAMTWAGCEEASHDEIARVLGFDADPQRVHRAIAALNAALERDEEDAGPELHMANRLWGSSGVPADYYQQPVLDLLARHYGALFARLDFSDEPVARTAINSWVSERTRKRVSELVPAGALSPDTVLVLVNAIYFKGRWAAPFDTRLTRPRAFHLDAGRTVQADMMSRVGNYATASVPGATLLELPYEGEEFSMLVALPDAGRSLAALERGLTASKLATWRKALRAGTVRLSFPRFRLESHRDLAAKVLPALGMKAPFASSHDWRPLNGGRDPLFISNVFHGAFVEVDEAGSEAAGATAIAMKKGGGGPPRVVVDRPFLFAIQHRKSGSILFLGRVADPSST